MGWPFTICGQLCNSLFLIYFGANPSYQYFSTMNEVSCEDIKFSVISGVSPCKNHPTTIIVWYKSQTQIEAAMIIDDFLFIHLPNNIFQKRLEGGCIRNGLGLCKTLPALHNARGSLNMHLVHGFLLARAVTYD